MNLRMDASALENGDGSGALLNDIVGQEQQKPPRRYCRPSRTVGNMTLSK